MTRNRIRQVGSLITALVAGAARAQDGGSVLDRVDRPLVLEVPGAAGARLEADVAYRPDGQPWQRLDLYRPVGKGPFPVVVLVHGAIPDPASSRPKDWGFYRSWGRALAASGFAAVAFNHRLGHPEPRLEQAQADLAALLGWIATEGKRLELDPARVGLVFFSAGGQLAAPFLAAPSASIKALVAFYPLLGADALSPQAPPVWIARAGRDAVPGLLPALDRFAGSALAAGLEVTVVNHAQGEHGFDSQDASPRSRQVVRAAIAFLDERLRGEPDLAARTPFVDYDPPQTLRVPEHPTERARFPFVDVHSHQFGLDEAGVRAVVAAMDAMNMAVMVNLSGRGFRRIDLGGGKTRSAPEEPRYLRDLIALTERVAPGRIVHFTNVDFGLVGTPGWAERAVAELEADVAAGARGLKIYKSLGMDTLDAAGRRIAVDDPRLDPVFAACARLGIPVLIHTADPFQFWQPRDKSNERLYELIEVPGRTRDPRANIPWEQLIAEQHALFRRHPGTRFIDAHLGWLGNDLQRLGRLLDECPNVSVEIGAVLAELGRQPRFARDWITRYQDRVLFGKDSWEPSEYRAYFRVLETDDDSFPYYRRRHAFWKLYGLDLPDAVLRKLYYDNALRLVPGLDARRLPPP